MNTSTSSSSGQGKKKMTANKFSEYVMDVHDLYELALRNGFYLPEESSSAVNELMLLHVLNENYWCPLYETIKLKPCPKAPQKETLIEKLNDLAFENDLNISWIDEKHQPDKKWLVDVIATLKPDDEIFNKDYRPPPIRKRQ